MSDMTPEERQERRDQLQAALDAARAERDSQLKEALLRALFEEEPDGSQEE